MWFLALALAGAGAGVVVVLLLLLLLRRRRRRRRTTTNKHHFLYHYLNHGCGPERQRTIPGRFARKHRQANTTPAPRLMLSCAYSGNHPLGPIYVIAKGFCITYALHTSDLGLFAVAVAGLGDSTGSEDDRLPSKNATMVNRRSFYSLQRPYRFTLAPTFDHSLDQTTTKPGCQHRAQCPELAPAF